MKRSLNAAVIKIMCTFGKQDCVDRARAFADLIRNGSK